MPGPTTRSCPVLPRLHPLLTPLARTARQLRTRARTLTLTYGLVLTLGSRTLSQVQLACGGGDRDWSAAYRLFRQPRLDQDAADRTLLTAPPPPSAPPPRPGRARRHPAAPDRSPDGWDRLAVGAALAQVKPGIAPRPALGRGQCAAAALGSGRQHAGPDPVPAGPDPLGQGLARPPAGRGMGGRAGPSALAADGPRPAGPAHPASARHRRWARRAPSCGAVCRTTRRS